MIFLLSCLLFNFRASPCLAHAEAPAPAAAAQAVDQTDLGALERFVGLVENGKKEDAAELLRFPIARQKPLAPIRNKQEFVARFEDFIDPSSITELKNALKNKEGIWTGWQGTTMGGALWAEGGKIKAINVSTPKQKKAAAEALKLEKRNTHSSVDKYEVVEFACDAPSHRVRVQRMVGGNYRYVSWRPGEALSAVPEQVLEKGEAERQGTGGGFIYRFRDGKTTYEVKDTELCGEDCDDSLTITRGKKTILKEVCKPLP